MADQRDVLTSKILTVNPDGSREDWTARVRYERGGDRFYVDVPLHLDANLTLKNIHPGNAEQFIPKHGRIYGQTPQAALAAVNRAIDDYIKSLHTKRKVILYQFGYKKDGCEGVGFHFSDDHGSGTILQVDWDVCWEHTMAKTKRYSRGSSPEGSSQHSADEWKVLDWTPERQKFFQDFQLAIDQLIKRVEDVVGDDKKLLKFMDSGRVPLLTGPEDKKKS